LSSIPNKSLQLFNFEELADNFAEKYKKLVSTGRKLTLKK